MLNYFLANFLKKFMMSYIFLGFAFAMMPGEARGGGNKALTAQEHNFEATEAALAAVLKLGANATSRPRSPIAD